ncbi:hypothetical protein ACIA8K_06850 [Catenuloplanes sp. NPDC051500]|uniref:hypothetical protein n=1 Tax=Catenuloplanes sp. NPDC051500 TaxID=3363959 RepID=UPI00379B9FA3
MNLTLAALYRDPMPPQERAALDLLQSPMFALRVAVEVRRHIVHIPERGKQVPVIDWRALSTAVEDGALDVRTPDGRRPVPSNMVRLVRIACSLGAGTSIDLRAEMGGLDRHEAIAVAAAVARASDVDLRQLVAALDEQLVRGAL